MFHWAWGIVKRRLGQNLMLGGLLMMGAVAVHLKMLERAGAVDRSLRTADITILAVFGDAMFALFGVAMLAWGMWRIAHGKP